MSCITLYEAAFLLFPNSFVNDVALVAGHITSVAAHQGFFQRAVPHKMGSAENTLCSSNEKAVQFKSC